MNELTTKQEQRLNELVKHVKTWIDDRFRVGTYLSEIRDSRLYKRDFDTFEEFCEKTFGFKRAQAYRLIEASELKETPEGKHLENERQARALKVEKAKFEPKMSPMGDKIVNLDKTGYPIPDDIIEGWNRADSIGKDIMRKASELKCEIQKAKEIDDPAFREITNSAVTYAINIYGSLRQIIPHAVCTSCQGRNSKKCSFCSGRGYFSEHLYRNAVPEEIKKLRLKSKV